MFKYLKYFLLIFIVLEALLFLIVTRSFDQKEQNYLAKKTERLGITYSVVIKSFGIISENIYNEVLADKDILKQLAIARSVSDKEQNKIRDQLYKDLLQTFNNLKRQQLRELHFHLSKGNSFLSFRNPGKYGQNLSKTRNSIMLVNEKQERIIGFECGECFTGFCYMFPLFYKDKMIGSVETGITFDGIRQTADNLFPNEYNFILKKNVLPDANITGANKRFIPSNLNPAEYYIETKSFTDFNKERDGFIPEKKIIEIDKALAEMPEFKNTLNAEKVFAVPLTLKRGESYIVCFQPIPDVVSRKIGYMVSYSRDNTVVVFNREKYAMLALWTLFFLAILIFVYHVLRNKVRIRENRIKLLDSQEQFRIMANNVPGVIFRWLQTGSPASSGFIYISHRSKDILGIEPEKLMNNRKLVEIHPDDRLKVEKTFADSMREHKDFIGEFRLNLPSGRTIWVRASAHPTKAGSKETFFDGIVIDITKEKENEAKIAQAKHDAEAAAERAEAATRAKSEFLANMSHDIRTPLNGVIGVAQVLSHTRLDPKQREYVEDLNESGNLLMSIINDILDFSKIEAGRLEIEAAPFDFYGMLNKLCSLMRFEADKKKLDLNLDYEANCPRAVCGDATRIRQVVMNLVGNALKFTQAGGLTVSVSALGNSGDTAVFTVKVTDTGIGIPEDKIPQLFDKFTQADSSTTRKFGGTGLGLAICKLLVEKMNGRIRVESKSGKGSTFIFSLPLQLTSPDQIGQETEDVKVDWKRQPQILIAEDSEINRKVVQFFLDEIGCVSEIAETGREAVEKAAAKKYDLILMDVQLPEMDGVEATRKILKKNKNTCIVALTANAMEDQKNRCLEVGMCDFITKPIIESELKAVLCNMLRDLLETNEAPEPEEQPDKMRQSEKPLVLDMEVAIGSAGGNESLFKEMIQLFMEETPANLSSLNSMIRREEYSEARKYAHKIKGEAALMGAIELQMATTDLEYKLLEKPSPSLMANARNLNDIYGRLKIQLLSLLEK